MGSTVQVSLTRVTALRLLAGALVAFPTAIAAQSVPKLRVGIESSAETFAEPYYGVQAGIFARDGLDVDLEQFPTAGPIVSALLGGSLDIGAADVILLANAVNRGVPLLAIAASGLFRTAEPTSGLYVLKTSSIRSAKELEGQTVAVGTLVSLTSVSLRMWLAQNGADPAKVQFIEMKFGEMPAALEHGTVAAAYLVEPLITAHAAALKLLAIPYGAIASTFPISVIVATRPWLAQNDAIARKFVTALYETARWANANRPQTAGELADYSHVNVDLIRRMHRTSYATGLNAAMLQPVLDAAAANKLIDRPTNAADLIARLG